ncbi:MAG TPA: hypothetical protein VHD36_01585 [Pirellulales bacterium]|nr:hypothetical protein [Pirellulales bacterium]
MTTAAALALVARYSSNSPYADEWPWLDVVVGDRPFDSAWLLEPENHHRVPLTKLLYIGLARLTNYDFRAGAVANVLVLSGASLGLLWAVRRARGETRLSDVVIPIALLHLGHWYNLIWGHQLFFAMAAALMCAAIGIIINTRGPETALRNGLLVALACAVLIGCGGPGVCFLPALALWLAVAGLTLARSNRPGCYWSGGILLAAAAGCLALVIVYFAGNRPTEGLPDAPAAGIDAARLWATMRGTLQVLSISAGRLGQDTWPASGIIVAGLILAALAMLAIVWRRSPEERLRAAGLACAIASVVTVALGVGWSRGTIDPTYCLTARYSLLSCPLVVALYGVFVLYGREPRWHVAEAATAGIAVVIGMAYVSSGIHQSQEIRARVARMELLVADGLSPSTIGTRSAWDMQDEERSLARHLEQMCAVRIGPYRHGSVPVATVDAEVHRLAQQHAAEAKRTKATISPTRPWVQDLALAPGQRVFRIDLRVRNRLHRAPLPEQLGWKIVKRNAAGAEFELATGTCDLECLPDPMFAVLRFAAITAEPKCHYELVVVRSDKWRLPFELPVFAADATCPTSELDGYVYVLREETPIVATAGRTAK